MKTYAKLYSGLLALLVLASCSKESIDASSNSNTSNGSVSALPDTAFVLIPANPTFSFKVSTTNSGVGESAAIAADYYLNKYLVTNAQYKVFCDATSRKTPSYWKNSTYPDGKANHPVLSVSLTDANAYCTWLGTKNSNYTFRVPSEAEWENAAAGPNKTTYPWGNSSDLSYTNGVLTTNFCYYGVCAAFYLNQPNTIATYTEAKSPLYGQKFAIKDLLSMKANGSVSGWKDESKVVGFAYTDIFDAINAAGGYTTPVGSFPKGKSYYGVYDMVGEVFAWTSSVVTANNGAEKGQQVNAVRGGSWYAHETSCTSFFRGEGRSGTGAYNTVGFRVAASKK